MQCVVQMLCKFRIFAQPTNTFIIMATVKPFIRISTKKANEVNIRFRLSDGRNTQLFHKSELTVNSDLWDEKNQCIKAKVIINIDKRTSFNKAVMARKELIIDIFNAKSNTVELSSEWLELEIDKALNPTKYFIPVVEVKQQTFFEAYAEFMVMHKMTSQRKEHFEVLFRALKRFQLYLTIKNKQQVILELDTLNSSIIKEFEYFLTNEYTLGKKFADIYIQFPETRTPKPRGQNTINGILTKLRTFVLWANELDEETSIAKTTNNPFKKFSIKESVYGTPFYITIDERNMLYRADLSERKQLAIQRDIFVFQCLIGCRVGDLYKMTKDNVMNGAIEYIPRKTKEGRSITVRVPLNAIAIEILSRYTETETLFPFISEQKYNVAIKDMFLITGLTRMVTVINTVTREEEKRPLDKIASSHLARRCFVGNLYKQVKDPSLVGSLSGHKEGSKAFARYREIDEDMKKDLVNLLM